MNQEASYAALMKRYEDLKKLYFSSQASDRNDVDGPVPNAMSRAYLVTQFNNIGAELPIRPDQPFTPIRRYSNS